MTEEICNRRRFSNNNNLEEFNSKMKCDFDCFEKVFWKARLTLWLLKITISGCCELKWHLFQLESGSQAFTSVTAGPSSIFVGTTLVTGSSTAFFSLTASRSKEPLLAGAHRKGLLSTSSPQFAARTAGSDIPTTGYSLPRTDLSKATPKGSPSRV